MINLTLTIHSTTFKNDYKINLLKNDYKNDIQLHPLYHYSYLFPHFQNEA